VKYTTARLVAEKALRRLFGRTGAGLRVRPGSGRPPSRPGIDLHDPDALLRGRAVDLAGPLRALLREEAVLRLDDLILRRTDWGHVPREAAAAAVRIREVLGLGSEDGWIV
jgi:glycerol-3-phosphate dehydrogenase